MTKRPVMACMTYYAVCLEVVSRSRKTVPARKLSN